VRSFNPLYGLEVTLSHLSQIKFPSWREKLKLTQGELRDIMYKFERDILRWIEGFKKCGYQVECERFMTVYWWGPRDDFTVKRQEVISNTQKFEFDTRIVCGEQIYEVLPSRIKKMFERNQEWAQWKDQFLKDSGQI
jgi:hypothetical protein